MLRSFVVVLLLLVEGRAGTPAGSSPNIDATSRQSAAPVLQCKGAFFALSVSDLDASARWYAEKLGLRVVMRMPRQNGVAVAVLEGGGLMVELVQHDGTASASGTQQPERMRGFFKAGVMVDDLASALAELKNRGVEVAMGPFPARANQRANVIIRDNAGNLIQLFGPSGG